MKRWLLLVVLVVALASSGTVLMQYMPESATGSAPGPILTRSSSSAEKTTGPKAKAKIVAGGKTTFDFGTMPQRKTGKHTWTVKNEGQGDLELWMISSTCSCTLAKFKNGEKAVVKPGESTEIDLEFETRENNGAYAKGAEIGSNDPELQSFSLQVKGKVFPPVMTFPPEPVVNMMNISNDEPDHFTNVAVFSKDRPETKIVRVSSSNKEIEVKHSPLTDPEKKSLEQAVSVVNGEKLVINVKGGMPLGPFNEEVIVTTDHPQQPDLRLRVNGKMLGPINFQPGALMMHEVYGKAGATGELTVVVRNQRETKIEVFRKPEQLKVEIAPPGPNAKPGRYRLIVTVPPGTPPQRIVDEIVLKTDHPKAAKVVVPVSVWIVNAN